MDTLKKAKFYLKLLVATAYDFLEIIAGGAALTAPIAGFKNKILIFNWRDVKHRYAGGAEVYIHELAKRWVKAGNKVTIFCGNDGKSKRYERVNGVEIVRRGGFYLVYFWAFIYYIFRFRKMYDLVIDCENGIPFFSPLYVRKKVFCLVFHVHQEVFRKSLLPPFAHIASFLEKNLMPLVYKKVTFLTISKSSQKDMKKHNFSQKNIHVVMPGVNVQIFRPGKKSSRPLILYLGRLKLYKGIDIFIYAAQKVLNKFPHALFVIAGDGEEREGIKHLILKQSREKQIILLGKVSEKEKIKLYQQAWMLVQPSLIEGFGMTVIEANACATVAVASNVPGLCDSVVDKKTGFLVKYGDVEEFSLRIVRLLKDRTKRETFSRNARKWAESFSWDKSADEALRILYENSNS